MDEDGAFVQRISEAHPGYTTFITHLATLASAYLPPFIYVTDTTNPRITASVIDAILKNISSVPGAPPTYYAHINGVACFTARLFYDTVLNALAGWKPSWETGCQIWPGDDTQRYNDGIDSFLHGLRKLRGELTGGPPSHGKGKGKAVASSSGDPTMVLLIERAERLYESLPDLLIPLTRLAELSQVNISVIFLSSVRWEEIKPPLGAAPDPYYINVDPLTKQDVISRLVSAYRATSLVQSASNMTYHPALQPFYEQYVDTLCSTISIYTNDPLELQYIAAARWPGFVKPVIDQYNKLAQQAEADGVTPPDLESPGTEARLRLLNYFLPTFPAALDALYPRLMNATDWAADNDYDQGQALGDDRTRVSSIKVDHLPRMSKFILIAAFLASTNPAKSDMRMLGRGAEERKKKRRKSVSPKKTQMSVVKISQRLLGPTTFPLDRLFAILGALLEENDFESRPHDPRFELPGEYTDMEIGRIHVYAAITEMTFMRALHRTTGMDKLDGPPMFKCGISHEVALALARDVDVPLNDLIIRPNTLMPTEHTSASQDYPLQRLGSELKDSVDLESIASEDKDTEEHEYPSSVFDDPNLDPDQSSEFDDDSPYPEVRSAVANTDDPTIPVTTLRTWVIGLAWAVVMPGVNQVFFFRYPAVPITGIVAQLLSFPLGKLWETYVPRKRILGVSLNPGPFSIKEHVLITIMASVGAQSAYATDIIAVQRVFYNQRYSFSYQWFLVMSTQLIGFSAGGVTRRFLVSPPSMVWPTSLVSCAMFNTLHSQQYAGTGRLGGISRERFFLYAFTGSFLWYFFPGYLFQALSYFSWVTWIWPEDAVIAQLFGYMHGMGMSVITFDWGQIAYIGSPLATPWWAAANILFGFVIFYWILTPILYFTNTWNSLYMPIQSRLVYDSMMQPYNVSRILSPQLTLDMQAYESYSPLFMSTSFAVSYGMSFATITATLVHAFVHFRKQIIQQARRSLREQPDVHARLMSQYPQVPEWWYLALFGAMFAFGVISIELWPTHMPVWAFVIALVIAFTYVIPCGMIQAITNQQVGLNVVTELIIGYALPGRPVAMMMFKTWGYITMTQALTFTADFKLGHYMKIPPRKMFWCQIIAAVIAGTTQLAVELWMFEHIPDICTTTQQDGFVCPNTQVFGTASIIWGVVGPKLQFSSGHLYNCKSFSLLSALLYFFIVGAIAPIIPWLLMKRWPNSFLRYINPVIFNGTKLIPPATALNFVPWALVGFVFQFVIRRRNFAWWAKYNYVLSAALDSGLALSVLTIFFTLQYPRDETIGQNTIQNWWGNRVFQTNYDGRGIPVRQLAPGETFG
ncbi:small oligopeptide transporter [Paxillus ammoniavirescens]|nr:small oligopeptide transporter [Paxillus ammoniavirescens]